MCMGLYYYESNKISNAQYNYALPLFTIYQAMPYYQFAVHILLAKVWIAPCMIIKPDPYSTE